MTGQLTNKRELNSHQLSPLILSFNFAQRPTSLRERRQTTACRNITGPSCGTPDLVFRTTAYTRSKWWNVGLHHGLDTEKVSQHFQRFVMLDHLGWSFLEQCGAHARLLVLFKIYHGLNYSRLQKLLTTCNAQNIPSAVTVLSRYLHQHALAVFPFTLE